MRLAHTPLAALLIAAFVPFAAAAAEMLPRDTVVPASAVIEYFPEVTQEATELNQTSVGDATASISVVFTSPDGKKKVTLSIDQYASAADAAAAFATAVKASEIAPGYKQAETPDLGEEALAGSSQVGEEQHFGLGAREGRLIVSATHAGDIPVTAENTASLVTLSADTLAAAHTVLGD